LTSRNWRNIHQLRSGRFDDRLNLRTITHAGPEVHGTVNGAITPVRIFMPESLTLLLWRDSEVISVGKSHFCKS
jgi:hypothetical protein